MIGWTEIEDANAWAHTLATLPSAHVLQSWAWGAFKSRWGWSARRWASADCAVQVLRRNAGPFCVLYATKGPAARDLAGYERGLQLIEAQARDQRAIWAKVDGDPPTSSVAWSPADLDALRALLRRRGWLPSPDQIQFRNTMLTDVDAADEALLSRMGSKCRYNVRLSERRGVRVRMSQPMSASDAELLYGLYAETGARDGFRVREKLYYLDAWRTMGGAGFIAEHESVPLAGLIVFKHGRRAWYFYGMSGAAGREHMPNHLLQWHALRWARDNGCAVYDWWGAPETLVETDAMWGVYRFKEGFGAAFAEGIGAWDYAPNRALYRASVEALPKVRGIIRRGLHQAGATGA